MGGIRANLLEPATFLFDNLAIQMSVMEAARLTKVKKLLFVASTCIYPAEAPQPLKEEYLFSGPCEPSNEGYAIAKLAGVKLCEFYWKQYGCHFISAAPTNLFGINDHYDLEKSHLLPALIAKIHLAKMKGESNVELWGTGKPRREFMLSDECADALFFLMQHYDSEKIINVGTGTDLSILELAEVVAGVLKFKAKFIFNPSKPDGMMRKLVDVTKINQLGWQSRISLEEAIGIAYKDYLSKFAGN